MYHSKSILLFLILLFSLLGCHSVKENDQHQYYENQIGDTPFDSDLDDPQFEFCDQTDVLHKRAFVRYKGGMRAINGAIIDSYQFQSSYASYSGYFIVRFAVNCNDEAGRFRMETLDSNFNLAKCPKELEYHILSLVKGLKGWGHPVYDGKDYDGYKFLTIKMVNGQIK